MNSERMEKAIGDIAAKLEQQGGLREHAKYLANQTMADMVDKQEAFELTEDEERMLKAYRKYRERNATGVFAWKVEQDLSLVVPESPSLIVDPRDVSETASGPS